MFKIMAVVNKYYDPKLFSIKTENGTIKYTAIFIPLLIENILLNTLGTVNTAVLSNVSEDAVAAVGAANQLILTLNVLITMITTGAAAVVNNLLGAGKKQDAAEASGTAIIFCCAAGLFVGVALAVFRYQTVSLLNLEDGVNSYAVTYFAIRCLFFIIPVATVIINNLMRCYGIAKTAVYSGFTSNGVNLLGNLFVVYLFRGDIERIILMVGIVCVFSQLCGLAVSAAHFKIKSIPLGFPQNAPKLLSITKKILKIGIPNGISGIGFTISQTMTTSFVALLGTEALSAKIYFTTISSYCYMFSLTMGHAAAVLVGRYSGAGEYEKANRFCRQLCRVTSALNLFISLLFLTFNRQILSLFTSQESILRMAVTILIIDLVIEQVRARSHVYERTLLAAGDSFFCMPIIIISGLINGVGLGYLLAIHFGLGLPGVWCGFAADETVRMIVTALRWKTGKWTLKSKAIVE